MNLMAGQMHQDLYFDRHQDLCNLIGVEPAPNKPSQNKDWRGSSSKCSTGIRWHDGRYVLMHRYHVGSHSGQVQPHSNLY
jgi:hypothetical protein